MADDDDVLMPAAQVRKRYGGASEMWLHRRLHDNSGFPKPVYIGALRYWRKSELDAWDRNLPRERVKLERVAS